MRGGVIAALAAAAGLALIITAATQNGTNTAKVIDSMAWGGVHIAEAALGQKP
jgi:hypothetical protein